MRVWNSPFVFIFETKPHISPFWLFGKRFKNKGSPPHPLSQPTLGLILEVSTTFSHRHPHVYNSTLTPSFHTFTFFELNISTVCQRVVFSLENRSRSKGLQRRIKVWKSCFKIRLNARQKFETGLLQLLFLTGNFTGCLNLFTNV